MTARRVSSSRSESKEITRQALLRAALKLLARNTFDSLSLREVTRQAGISPTAFYRHFDDMEELGLVLVEESFGSLREMLRDVRVQSALDGDTIKQSMEVVHLHVQRQGLHFRFIARERYGGVRRLRRAIRRELQLFADELAVDLIVMEYVRDWSPEDRRALAGLIVETVVHMVAELLDADPDEQDLLVRRTERQLRLAALGVPAWESRVPRARVEPEYAAD